MSSRVIFKLDGYEDAVKKIGAANPKLEKKIIRKAMRPPAKLVLADLKKAAPVLTGKLKASLKIRSAKRSRKNKNKIILLVATAQKDFTGIAYHASFLEYGTRKMKPKRWMRDTTEPNEKKYSTSFVDSLTKTTNETIKELAGGNLS